MKKSFIILGAGLAFGVGATASLQADACKNTAKCLDQAAIDHISSAVCSSFITASATRADQVRCYKDLVERVDACETMAKNDSCALS